MLVLWAHFVLSEMINSHPYVTFLTPCVQ